MAAHISNISENDFSVLARAANDAKDRGDMSDAEALDKLARKANASLTNSKYAGAARFAHCSVKTMKWSQAPSTLL